MSILLADGLDLVRYRHVHLPDATPRTGDPSGNEPAHHKIANKPNTPISMSKTAAVMAIGRMAL
jgi:hypothetical protein